MDPKLLHFSDLLSEQIMHFMTQMGYLRGGIDISKPTKISGFNSGEVYREKPTL